MINHFISLSMSYVIRYAVVAMAILTIACRPIQHSESLELTLIKSVLEKESMAFYNRNFHQWASCYKQNDQTFWVQLENKRLLEARGWGQLQILVQKYMENNPTTEPPQIVRENYHARIADEIAWITFDELRIESKRTRKLRGIRILEKTDGHWQITYVNSYDAPSS